MAIPILNWQMPDSLIHSYGVGDVVWTNCTDPTKRYKVIKKRLATVTNLGGYEVQVECVSHPSDRELMGFWMGAYNFFPEKLLEQKNDRYPHKCRFCGAPAWEAMNIVDCSANCRALKAEFRK